MSKPSFIYAAWLQAKRDLYEKLDLSESKYKVLNEWFKRNVFEFGGEHTIALEMLNRENPDKKGEITSHCVQQTIHKIAEEIYRKGMFQVTVTDDATYGSGLKFLQTSFPLRRIRVRVLLCGSPEFVGNAEHKTTG